MKDPTMERADNPMSVIVWGDYAVWTRPEAKTERVSYPVPTPSGVRGVLEAIYWKPEFTYRIREIHVLKPIRYASLLRNEITDKMPDPRSKPVPIDIAEKRTQRHTLALMNVAYRIYADVIVRPEIADDPAKYRDQFRRRVRGGQRFHQPYLGCREFAAHFAAPEDAPEALQAETHGLRPIPVNMDLGLMLLDLAFPAGSDASIPLFFPARLDAGVLRVDDSEYEKLAAIAGPLLPRPPKEAR